MGCLGGCLNLVFGLLWKAVLAALVGVVLARVEAHLERRGGIAHRAWRAWRYRDFS